MSVASPVVEDNCFNASEHPNEILRALMITNARVRRLTYGPAAATCRRRSGSSVSRRTNRSPAETRLWRMNRSPKSERLIRIVGAVGGPRGYLVGGTLSPSIHVSGEQAITAAA